MRISDGSSDVCSSDLHHLHHLTVIQPTVGTQIDLWALLRVAFGFADVLETLGQVRHQRFYVVDVNTTFVIKRYLHGLLRLVERIGAGFWQVDRHAGDQQQRRHHEDDKQHQHDVDQRRYIDEIGRATGRERGVQYG